MKPAEIAAKGAELTKNNTSNNSQIEVLTLSMIDMDEFAFERIFTGHLKSHGFETTIVELIYPFLDKLRVLWLTSSINPAQEKFINQLIRRKLMDYQLRAVSEGKDALGELTVKVDFGDGELITGKGASTDVIEASARAYLNAVNRHLNSDHTEHVPTPQP